MESNPPGFIFVETEAPRGEGTQLSFHRGRSRHECWRFGLLAPTPGLFLFTVAGTGSAEGRRVGKMAYLRPASSL